MREQTQDYCKNNGVKQTWIAEQLNISKQRLNMYIKNKRNLPENILEQLEKIVNK